MENLECYCCHTELPRVNLFTIKKKLYCLSCRRKALRSLDAQLAFIVFAVVLLLGVFIGRAST